MTSDQTNFSTGPIPIAWREGLLNDRQQQQVAFAELYVSDFAHGATGHNDYLLIARLAELLDVAAGVRELPRPPAAADLVLTFGKYRDLPLAEVWRRDPGYVEWLAREGRDADVRAAAQALLTPTPAEAAPAADASPAADEGELPF